MNTVSNPACSMPDDTRAADRRAVLDAVFTLNLSQALGTLVRHGVPDLLADGPLPANSLAARARLHPLSTERVLRVLAGHDLFTEVEPGVFANTPASDLLRDRPDGMRNLVLHFSADYVWRQFADVGHTLRTGESAWEHANGTSFWDYLSSRPEAQRIFNATLSELRGDQHPAVEAAYDWTTVRTVVDVGGGNGSLLATILGANGHLAGVLLDQEDVLPDADVHLRSRGVRDRCELVACNFFESLPATGEAWILSQVLHDWDDAGCRVILERCRERLRPADRLLVVEIVTVPCEPDRRCGFSDINMMTLFGEARQRTADEYRSLYSECGLELSRVVPTESSFSIVEAQPLV
jgi:hypothetical protein